MHDSQQTNENYIFPWGFHLGDLQQGSKSIPLYTSSEDGGFCLLYDKISEKQVDNLLESLCLELLVTMPSESLKISMFDYGKKKFYNLSPLKTMHFFENAYDKQLSDKLFDELESLIVSRYTDLLCCTRQTIDEHNQKSKIKQSYHVVLINLEVFPTNDTNLRRIQNFVESAKKAGVYIIAFGNNTVETSQNETTQTLLNNFKKLHVKDNQFNITKEIFEFTELLEDHNFTPLNLDKASLMQKVLLTADIEKFLDPEKIILEENTKVV